LYDREGKVVKTWASHEPVPGQDDEVLRELKRRLP
jgi:hypothetical protein